MQHSILDVFIHNYFYWTIDFFFLKGIELLSKKEQGYRGELKQL